MSREEVVAGLTRAGAMFEVGEADVRGAPVRVWVNAPATLRHVLEGTRSHGSRDFLVYGDERITFSEHVGLVAGLAMFPIGWLVLGRLNFDVQPVALVVFLLLGAVMGACLGLVLGTLVPPNRINVLFSLVLTPMLFTGASMYPWAALDSLRWFQIVTMFNPLTYMSEGIRAALIPDVVPHMHPGVAAAGLLVALLVAGAVGTRGFLHRAID